MTRWRVWWRDPRYAWHRTITGMAAAGVLAGLVFGR
jgi:hypothetical protein